MRLQFGHLDPTQCEHRRITVTHVNDLMISWECKVCGHICATPVSWLENSAKRLMRQQTNPRGWERINDYED